MDDTLTVDERFFYENAAWSYAPAHETPEEGRLRCARDLAAAEARMRSGPYYWDVVPDDEPYDGDVPYDGPVWVVRLWSIEGRSHGPGYLMAAIGGVACEENDDYLRVVAAELADQYIKGES